MSSSQSSGYLEKSSEPRLLLPFRVMDGRRERDKKERRKRKRKERASTRSRRLCDFFILVADTHKQQKEIVFLVLSRPNTKRAGTKAKTMRRGVSEPRSGDELRVPRRGSFSAQPSAFTTSSRFSSNAASAAFKLDRRQQVLLEDVKSFQGIKVGRKYLDMRGVSHPTYASSFLISMSTGVENLNRVEVLWTVRHRFSAFEELRDSVWAEVFAPFPKQFSTFKRFVTLGDRDLLKRAQQLNLWMTELWLSRVMWSTAERFAVQCFLEAALPVRYSTTMTVVSSGPEIVGWASSRSAKSPLFL